MTIEQFENATEEEQNAFLKPFKNSTKNISKYKVDYKIIRIRFAPSGDLQ